MDTLLATLSTGDLRIIVLVVTFTALYLIESGIPFQRNDRKHLSSNLVLTISVVLVNLMFSWITVFLLNWAEMNGLGVLRLIDLGTGATLVVSILFLDFWAAYLSHRIMHSVPALWSVHSIHHSDTMIDVSSAFRQHPLETVFRIFFHVTGALILGIPVWMLGLYLLLSAANGQLEHSNISLPERVEKILRHFYTTPDTHKVHHSKIYKESNSNYGNLFCIWDRLFGTYLVIADVRNIRYGLDYLPDSKKSNSLGDLLTLNLKKDSE